jgi:hypothetical protein
VRAVCPLAVVHCCFTSQCVTIADPVALRFETCDFSLTTQTRTPSLLSENASDLYGGVNRAIALLLPQVHFVETRGGKTGRKKG